MWSALPPWLQRISLQALERAASGFLKDTVSPSNNTVDEDHVNLASKPLNVPMY